MSDVAAVTQETTQAAPQHGHGQQPAWCAPQQAAPPANTAEDERRQHQLKYELPDEARGVNALRWVAAICGGRRSGDGLLRCVCKSMQSQRRERAQVDPGGERASLR